MDTNHMLLLGGLLHGLYAERGLAISFFKKAAYQDNNIQIIYHYQSPLNGQTLSIKRRQTASHKRRAQ